MSNPDPNLVDALAEEIDDPGFNRVSTHVGERVDIAAPSVSFPGESEESGYDPNIAHRRRLRKVRP